MVDKNRILALLGNGVAPGLVASAVGCDHSYISQLLSNEEFALSVATLRCKDLEEVKERDNRYDKIEDKLLERLENIIPFIMRPREILHALQVVNSAKRRSLELQGSASATQNITNNNVVILQLPTKTINTFELSAQNEVVSVQGKALVPMSTDVLMKQLSVANAEEEKRNAIENLEREAKALERERSLPAKISERLLCPDSV